MTPSKPKVEYIGPMKRILGISVLLLVKIVASCLPMQAQATTERQAPCPANGDTLSLLQPQDPGYHEAEEFGRFLQNHQIVLRCITRTTIGSNFMGEVKSSAFQTDMGPISVVFFPAPDGAERVTSELKVTHGTYRYTFRTRQSGLLDHQVMESDGPFHFMIHGSWFMFTYDSRTEQALRFALLGYPAKSTLSR
jgi:hypothetical protein